MLGTSYDTPDSSEPVRLPHGEGGRREWADEGGGGWLQGGETAGETEGGNALNELNEAHDLNEPNDNLPLLSRESPPPLYSP